MFLFICRSRCSIRIRKIVHPISQSYCQRQVSSKNGSTQFPISPFYPEMLLPEKLQKSLPKIHLKSQNSISQKNYITLLSRNNIQASKHYTVITSKNMLNKSKSWGQPQILCCNSYTGSGTTLQPWSWSTESWQ